MKIYTAILFGILAVSAIAQEKKPARGWYVGATAGLSKVSGSRDISKTASTIDDDDQAFGILGGYQFNKYFGLEAGYLDMGSLGFESADNNVSVDAVHFSAVGTLPLGQRFSLVGKLGSARRSLSQKLVEGALEEDTVDESENVVAWAGGFQYHFGGRWIASLTHSGISLDNPRIYHLDEYGEDDTYRFEVDGRYIRTTRVALKYRF